MALKLKERDRDEDDDLPVKSHGERALEKQERDFIANDRMTYDSIMSAYAEHREIMDSGTVEERVMHYATLHVQRGFAAYLIGEGWREEQVRIDKGGTRYKSINEMFDEFSDRLPFDKRTMYQYMQIATAVTFDDFKKLGVKKALIVAQVKDEEKREKIIKEVSAKTYDEAKTREAVNRLFDEDRAQRTRAKEAEVKKILKAHPYSVKSATGKIDGRILVMVDPEDHAAMMDYLNRKEVEIKRHLENYEYADATD